jgi:uncharacterized membrane protein YdfJ with MMPL/SSD domain
MPAANGQISMTNSANCFMVELLKAPVEVSGTHTAVWARRVARHPVLWGGVTLVVLRTLAAPVLGMRTWPQDAGGQPTSNTTRARTT